MDIVISWGKKYLGHLFGPEGRGVTIVKLGEIGEICKGVAWGGGGEHCMGEGRGEARSGYKRVVWGRI